VLPLIEAALEKLPVVEALVYAPDSRGQR